MSRLLWIALTGVLLAALFPAVAVADVVVVTPGNMQGWSMVTVNPAPTTGFSFSDKAPGGGPRQFGALYANFENEWDQLTQAWIGRNDLTGVRLADVTNLTYSTYTVFRGWGSVGGDWIWDRQSRQTWQIKLCVKYNPADTKFRHLVYRPWGLRGENRQWGWYETWQTWDCLNEGIWADELNGAKSGSWQWFVASYPDAVIVAPCQAGNEYHYDAAFCTTIPKFQTPTGCSFNVAVGSRDMNHPNFVAKNDDGTDGAWWLEGCHFEGFVDNITIGYNSGGSNIEHTYDFEPSEGFHRPVQTFGVTNKTLHTFPWINSARHWYKYTIWGKVMDWSTYYAVTGQLKQFPEIYGFPIDDGSGMPVQVRTFQPFGPGEYVRATGYISKIVTQGTWPPPPGQLGSTAHPFYFVPDETDVQSAQE